MASNPETKDALRSSARRIQIMANIHDHLTPSSPDRAVHMGHYLEELCQKIEEMRPTSGVAVRTTADEIVLPEKGVASRIHCQ
jgi:two-component system, sensor histidine kinase PdtaS